MPRPVAVMPLAEAEAALHAQKAALRADGYARAGEHWAVVRRGVGEAACRRAPTRLVRVKREVGVVNGRLGGYVTYRLADGVWAPAWAVEVAEHLTRTRSGVPLDLPAVARIAVLRRCAADPPLRDAIRATAALGMLPLLDLIDLREVA